MKNILSCFVFLIVFASNMFGVSFADFNLYQSDVLLNPFARDLGSCLGGGYFSGNNPGFPGVDVNAKFVILDKPSADNIILPANTLIGLPYVQAEIGLPMDFSIVARGMTLTIDGASIVLIGGGIKYKLLNDSLAMPGIAVLATYGTISGVPSFDASTISFNVSISKSLSPLPLAVFIYGGMDMSNVSSKVPGFTSIKGTATNYRVNAGARFSPLPLFYISGDMSLFAEITNYNIGAGISF
ncbi:MAG: hypothetical protein A2452_03550 [Candidatus Firestonebacteria bacterium RIFOXYC2_FULL_39_67]|nr:MAG: hypothetical protein A2536_00525 [Candidatus Firestonebacteria bacterium RIFOXYD2_FULL_39_29]OGF53073.1 MAG: hypothetical protein A2497_05395 [Candidatus Firestonebacteria bacterium RifOxyC12_full_39_7]OGF57151.1 MAG: hypothetical protein A2452_03550 [Candidatus Firestonebacteria bacterium RIFOXYC2_FULL_39_67]